MLAYHLDGRRYSKALLEEQYCYSVYGVCVRTCVSVYVCKCVRACVCKCVGVRAYVRACVRGSVRICVCVGVFARVHMHT